MTMNRKTSIDTHANAEYGCRDGRGRARMTEVRPDECGAEPASENQIVYVIEDDTSSRDSLLSLIKSVGIDVAAFSQSVDFLSCYTQRRPSCLLLDVRLKGESGLSAYEKILQHEIRIPVIFLTAYADVGTSVKAMKTGALDFLIKPFREQDLLDAVAKALDLDRRLLKTRQSLCKLRYMFASLTPRQREVMRLIVDGMVTKQIASRLNLSEFTVKIYRKDVMVKMQADSIADLVKKDLWLRKNSRF
jgi:FixJ family two-component response regulator